jgi:hypothetical protein
MTRPIALDNIDHQELRILPGHSPAFGDNVNQALVLPTEFGEVQREYPILFRKDSNGQLQAVALLGLDKDENLFLTDAGWQARYVPAVHRRGPFIIGLPKPDAEGGAPAAEPVILIDIDHPRVSRSEGEPLFLPQGGNAPCLERAARTLGLIHEGAAIAGPMFAAFEEAGLVEPAALEVQLGERQVYKLPDCYTINAERLRELDGATLERLNRAGFLYAAFYVLSSMGNIQRLIELKLRKNAAG